MPKTNTYYYRCQWCERIFTQEPDGTIRLSSPEESVAALLAGYAYYTQVCDCYKDREPLEKKKLDD